jgi:hypothetical protein
MDDHRTLYVAFLGSLLSSLLVFFDWPLLGVAIAKNRKNI